MNGADRPTYINSRYSGRVPEDAVGRLATSIEDFNSVFIRLPAQGRLSFSSLSVLHTLSRRGSCRLSDLVQSEQIKQPALTAAIAKLVGDGFVARERDLSDGRAVLLSLTPSGAAIVRGRHSGRVDRLRELVDRLSPDDRSRLLSVASVLDEVARLARETAPDGEE